MIYFVFPAIMQLRNVTRRSTKQLSHQAFVSNISAE
jgi:hypothetical protein